MSNPMENHQIFCSCQSWLRFSENKLCTQEFWGIFDKKGVKAPAQPGYYYYKLVVIVSPKIPDLSAGLNPCQDSVLT